MPNGPPKTVRSLKGSTQTVEASVHGTELIVWTVAAVLSMMTSDVSLRIRPNTRSVVGRISITSSAVLTVLR
mgnify:CR=1 FL=1